MPACTVLWNIQNPPCLCLRNSCMQCHVPLKSLRLRCPLSAALQRGLLQSVTLSLMNIWTSPSLPRHQKQVRGEEAKSPPVSWKTSNCFKVSEDSQHLFDFISGGLRGLWGSQCCWSALRVAQAAAQTDSKWHVLAASLLVVCSNWVHSVTLIRISECVYMQDQK